MFVFVPLHGEGPKSRVALTCLGLLLLGQHRLVLSCLVSLECYNLLPLALWVCYVLSLYAGLRAALSTHRQCKT